MRPWRDCSTMGRFMIICSIINVIVAVQLALASSYLAIFSAFMATYCWLMTYSKKCTKYDKT